MPELPSTVATSPTETTASAAKPRKAKKAKRAAKQAAKPSTNGKGGLRKSQVRILKHLAKKDDRLPRTKLAEVGMDRPGATMDGSVLGNPDPKSRQYEKKTGKPSLLTLGYVRALELDVDGKAETLYEITAAGRKAVQKI